MTPTPRLRFVEREEIVSHAQMIVKKIRVLQQLWMPTNEPYEEWLKVKDGEWRDVPTEKEQHE